jgi:hypothetical protein
LLHLALRLDDGFLRLENDRKGIKSLFSGTASMRPLWCVSLLIWPSGREVKELAPRIEEVLRRQEVRARIGKLSFPKSVQERRNFRVEGGCSECWLADVVVVGRCCHSFRG